MTTDIHPTAIVDKSAELAEGTSIGPYAIIGPSVHIGPRCVIRPYVHILGETHIGAENQFHSGCVIGDAPQDVKYVNTPTRLSIGDGNIFREHVTVHRSNRLDEDTVIGSNNFFMANSHVGHNSNIGNRVVVANGALIAGHVTIQDSAFISGNCLIHQFTRIGKLALMQGGSGISKDLPPYTIATGVNHIAGLNIIGLRRAGFNGEQRLQLKRLYRVLFRSGYGLRAALAQAKMEFQEDYTGVVMEFIETSKRGVCSDVGRGTPN